MMTPVLAIEGRLDSVQAHEIVASHSRDWTVRVRRQLYYPYYWFQLRYAVKTLLGRSGMQASCLVDTRTSLAATADPFEVEHVEAEAADVMDPRLAEDQALHIARRYVGYVLRNRRKALVVPEVEVLQRNLVYKPFWIVEANKREESSFRVLVDGVIGGFHVLRC